MLRVIFLDSGVLFMHPHFLSRRTTCGKKKQKAAHAKRAALGLHGLQLVRPWLSSFHGLLSALRPTRPIHPASW